MCAVLAIGLLVLVELSCAFDWERFDPRLATSTATGGGDGGDGSGGGPGGGAPAGGGGSGGTGGGAVESPMPIFRSVGPGNDAALADGDPGTLTIAGTIAQFSTPLPDAVGVGDALQYDSNGDGEPDALAFVHGRTSATEYQVRAADGTSPASVSDTVDWVLHRAYTSLADALAGNENPGITASLRDFDSGARDLVAADLLWQIACYADAVDSRPVVIEGWTTSAVNRLRIFAPDSPQLAGARQRHTGIAGSGYVMNTAMAEPLAHVIDLRSDHVDIEGLEITGWVNESANNSWEGVHVAASDALLSDLVIHDDLHPGTINPNADAINLNDMAPGWDVTVRNSIIYNLSRGAILYQGTEAVVVDIESCTIFNTGTSGAQADGEGGIAFASSSAAVVTVTNTISVGECVECFNFIKLGDDWGGSSNNISTDLTAPGPGSLTGIEPSSLFVSTTLGSEDLHLEPGVVAIDAGLPLVAFGDDIDGQTREPNAWDIGADEQL